MHLSAWTRALLPLFTFLSRPECSSLSEGTCLFHLSQRRKLLVIFILLCWIYSVFKRVLEEVGFICEGFRFRVVSKNVITFLDIDSPASFSSCPALVSGGSCAKDELCTHSHAAFQGAAVASLENKMFSWNLSGASCLNLGLLPKSEH